MDEPQPSGPGRFRAPALGLYLAFFASGAAGLLFESLWFYQAGLAVGNSFWAASLVLAAFMAGLTLGNLGAILGRVPGHPLVAYAAVELAIAVAGTAVVFLLPSLGRAFAPLAGTLAGHPGLVNPLRFLLGFLVLLVPATAMGFTLPVLAEALAAGRTHFGATLGRLYGVNTLGAVAGVLAGEYVLVARLGIRGTALAAAALNVLAAAAALSLRGRIPAGPAREREGVFPRGLGRLWLPVGLFGFLSLALEVLWFRFLALFANPTARVFAVLLGIVLAGIGLGGLAGGALLRRRPGAHRGAGLAALAAGACCALSYAAFPRVLALTQGQLADQAGSVLLLGLPLMFPVSLLSGLFFTLAGAAVRERFRTSQGSAGALTLVNTAGGILGSLAAGFILIPHLGVEASFFLVAVLYGAAGLVWWSRDRGQARTTLAGVALWILCLALFPFGTLRNRYLPRLAARYSEPADSRIIGTREGRTETLTYVETRSLGQPLAKRMLTNSMAMSSTFPSARRYMKEYVYWPLALQTHPRRALLICFGVGCTARALTDTRELERIDVVDISRDVLDLNPLIYPEPADQPLRDPRVRVHLEDGRYFLQTTRDTFDLITGEPPPPLAAGVVSLYTREYFQLVHDRLNEGGVATYWLPIDQLSQAASLSILRAFTDAFPDCYLWHGAGFNLMLVGLRGTLQRPAPDRFARQWRDPALAPELTALGFEHPGQLGAGFIGDGDYLRALTRGVEPLVDDFPKRMLLPGTPDDHLYATWIDTAAARDRFLASRSVSALWPPEMVQETLPYFAFEKVVTTLGRYAKVGGFPDFREVHRLATTSTLETPILWILGSSAEHQKAIANLPPKDLARPWVQYHLGIRALAARDYAAAADHLARSLPETGLGQLPRAAYLYALCAGGRVEEAQAKTREEGGVWVRDLPPGFLDWLGGTFPFPGRRR